MISRLTVAGIAAISAVEATHQDIEKPSFLKSLSPKDRHLWNKVL
jgi:hypothetical protein